MSENVLLIQDKAPAEASDRAEENIQEKIDASKNETWIELTFSINQETKHNRRETHWPGYSFVCLNSDE